MGMLIPNLQLIIHMFPRCSSIKLVEGYDFPMIPIETDYKHTILGETERCIKEVMRQGHSLRSISYEKLQIRDDWATQHNTNLKRMGWQMIRDLEKNQDDEDGGELVYRVCRT